MRRPRQVAALLAALLMLPALAACKPGEGGGDTSSAGGSTESTVAAPADIPVVSGKASEFVILRPDSADSTEIDVAKELREQLEEKTGCRLPMTVDWYIKAEPAAKYEIMVGHAEREEAQAVNAEIDAEDGFFYVIRVVGDKIIVTGKSANMIRKAIKFMLETFVDGEGNMTVPADLNIKSEMFTPTVAEYFAPGKDTTIKTKLVGEIACEGSCRVIQGGTSDGKYLYVVLNEGGNNADAKSVIVKIEIATMKTVAKKSELYIGHGNDIFYTKSNNEIVVVHNAPDRDTLSVFDADTLEFKRKQKLPLKIYCMSYDESLDCYWVGISGGDNFAKLDRDFKFVKQYISKHHKYTTQGMDSDDTYLYFIRYNKNCVIVYEKQGGYVGEYAVDFSGEPENIVHVGDEFYIIGNNKSWSGGLIYKATMTVNG